MSNTYESGMEDCSSSACCSVVVVVVGSWLVCWLGLVGLSWVGGFLPCLLGDVMAPCESDPPTSITNPFA